MVLTLIFWALGLATLVVAWNTARRILAPGVEPALSPSNTAVIVPCKGLDAEFPDFLQAVSQQELVDYRVYFVVADEQDPAVEPIRKLLARSPGLGELVVFPLPAGYSGKIANMIGGTRAAWADGAEYLVYLDSDTMPRPHFVAHLVAPLVRNKAVLTTGARILAPATGAIPQWLASLWMQSSLPGVTQPQQGSAWGGAMAIRAADAFRLDVAAIWRGAFSDDHTLSRAVRQEGGVIQFAPPCLISIPVAYGWSEFWDFLVRQLVTIRVHDPRLWYVAWSMIYPPFMIVAGLLQLASGSRWGVGTLAAILPAALAYYVVNEAVWRRLRQDGVLLRRQPLIKQIVILAALAFVHPAAMLRSAFIRRFDWRGRWYEVKRRSIAPLDEV